MMKIRNNSSLKIFSSLFFFSFLFISLVNGIFTPKAKAAKGKQEECKKVNAILADHGYARGQLIDIGPESASPTKTYANEHYWSFSNSDPYEMVEGKFTYDLYYKSCLLLKYTFYTYKK